MIDFNNIITVAGNVYAINNGECFVAALYTKNCEFVDSNGDIYDGDFIQVVKDLGPCTFYVENK